MELRAGLPLENTHRYLLARLHARNKDALVLDCGRGEGAALLAEVAGSVVALDPSAEAVALARRLFPARGLRFVQGSAEAIPLPDASVDLVVGFEAPAELDRAEDVLREIKRVLRPEGLVCLAWPENGEAEERAALLAGYFAHHALSGQQLVYGSFIAAGGRSSLVAWRANALPPPPVRGLPVPSVCLALASDGALPTPRSSLLEDRVEASAPYAELQLEGDAALRSARGELDWMYASRSWRMTKPLRTLAGRARNSSFLRALMRKVRLLQRLLIGRMRPNPLRHALRPPAVLQLSSGLRAGTGAKLWKDFPGKAVSIAGGYVCAHGAELSFADKPAVVMAHWDPRGVVDPYVIHTCRHFKALGWKVILASHSALRGLDRRPDWTDALLFRTCPGYDFTSWKAALDCFPSLLRAEELVLCNDSVFGAIGSHAPMHEAMRGVPCDFWGVTASYEILPHLQSYYLVFRRSALAHEALARFFRAVPLSDSRETAIRFETRLALYLALHGLTPGVYAPLADAFGALNPSHFLWRELLAHGVPLMKRDLLTGRHSFPLRGWARELEERGYPPGLAFSYCRRVGKGAGDGGGLRLRPQNLARNGKQLY